VRLETDRLVLREFIEGDLEAVFAYQSDPRYLQYYPWLERRLEDVRTFLNTWISWQFDRPRAKFQLAIVLAADGRLVGNCGLRKAAAHAQEAELGYEINPSYWGRGYASEAARAMLAFGFQDLSLHRVWAECVAANRASARVLEKLGMQPEGRLRENRWMKGEWWDTLLFGLLEREWAHAANMR
jgi:RimJ/RimL family protein N-acetyltransferase